MSSNCFVCTIDLNLIPKLKEDLSSQGFSISDQKDALLSNFSQWKGELEQVDDVCVIGVKV